MHRLTSPNALAAKADLDRRRALLARGSFESTLAAIADESGEAVSALRELDDECDAALDAEQDALLALHGRAHGPAASGSEHLELMRQEGMAGAGLGAAFHSAQE